MRSLIVVLSLILGWPTACFAQLLTEKEFASFKVLSEKVPGVGLNMIQVARAQNDTGIGGLVSSCHKTMADQALALVETVGAIGPYLSLDHDLVDATDQKLSRLYGKIVLNTAILKLANNREHLNQTQGICAEYFGVVSSMQRLATMTDEVSDALSPALERLK